MTTQRPGTWAQHAIGWVGVCLALVACHAPSSDEPERTNPWLAQVERDSPVVIANQRPLSDSQWNRLLSVVGLPGALGLDEGFRQYPSIQTALAQTQTAQGLRAAGFDPNGFFAVYAHQGRLIARLPLTDEARFWQWWAQTAAPDDSATPPAQTAPATDERRNQARVALPARQGGGLMTTESVVTLTTDADHLTAIWRAAGGDPTPPAQFDPPTDPWSDARWTRFNQRHQFDGHLSARLDLAGWFSDTDMVPAACRRLWAQTTSPIESIRFGTHRLDEGGVHWRADITTPLWAPDNTPTAPAAAGVDLGGVRGAEIAGLGASFNLSGLRERVLAWANATAVETSACPSGATWARHHRQLRSLANRPIPPIFSGLTGLTSRLDAWHSDELDSGPDYFTEVFLRNPQFLLGLAQMFSPDLADLDLRPNQTPVPLPERLTQTLGGVPVYLSTTPSSIRASATPKAHADTTEPATDVTDASKQNTPTSPWVVGTLQLDRLGELVDATAQWPGRPATAQWLGPLNDWAQASGARRIEFQLGGGETSLEVDLSLRHGPSDLTDPATP